MDLYSFFSVWFLVYFLLRSLAIAILILVLPVPRFVKLLLARVAGRLNYVLWSLAGILCSSMIPVYMTSLKAAARREETRNNNAGVGVAFATTEYFKWQRNMYMVTTALLLLIIFIRVSKLIREKYEKEDELKSIQAQIESEASD